ncbi:unnamed protein product [Moneuplotes crassus]|uniref:Cyclic nucleotide-binding domain-containing protein n=1 Tax=Euplotes crassus TaxID=5936 RepID=A0AAD1Y493_EUPCR|nr:unnamed protein product [Moneuplotes crassus]
MEQKVHHVKRDLKKLNKKVSELGFLKSVTGSGTLRKESVLGRRSFLEKMTGGMKALQTVVGSPRNKQVNSILPKLDNMMSDQKYRLEYIKTLTSKFILNKVVSIDNIKLEQNLLRILRIPEEERTDEQIYKLKKELERFSFFAEYVAKGNEDLVRKCAKVMKLEEYEANKIVFNYGEIGTKFYLVIKGSVKVLIPCTKKLDLTFKEYVKFLKENEGLVLTVNGTKFFSYPYPIDRIRMNPLFREATEIDSDLVDEIYKSVSKKELKAAVLNLYKKLKSKKKESYHLHFLTSVKHLKAGDQFGELALLNSKPRAATIMTNENTLLAVLSKKGFDRNLKNSENTKLEREIKELNNFGIFKNITRTSKSKLVKCISKEEVKKGQYLCKENEESVYVYIIKEGKFEILKELNVNLDTGIVNYTPLYLSTRELRKHKQFFDDYQCLVQGTAQIGRKISPTKSLRTPRIRKKVIKLSTITDGHVVGLSDYLFRSSHKFLSIKCISTVAQVAKMHINDIAANLNTIEVSKEMKAMVYKNLSILGESLMNSLKLQNTILLNTSREDASRKEDIDEISRTLEENEEHAFYQRLKSLKIVSPVNQVAIRHRADGKKDPKTIFYRQLCIEDQSTTLKRLKSPEVKIKERLFTQPIEDLCSPRMERVKTMQRGSRKRSLKSMSISSIRQKSVASLPPQKLSVAPPNFMYKSPKRSQNYHKVIFDKFGKTVIKTSIRNKEIKKYSSFKIPNAYNTDRQPMTERESVFRNLTINNAS